MLKATDHKKKLALGCRWISDLREVMLQMPDYSAATVRELLQVNRGPEGAHMRTLGLQHVVKKGEAYILDSEGVRESPGGCPIDLESKSRSPAVVAAPPFVEFKAIWEDKKSISGKGNNIFGKNGRLLLTQKSIAVPLVTAEAPLLAYYGAVMIKEGDLFSFPNDFFPLFRMEVAKKYFSEFMMGSEGTGVFLEYHHDQPHFHFPLNGAGGCYLLAKWNESGEKLQMSAFQIPEGSAIYSRKGAIHCDATLTGPLLVGYTISSQFSTVLLRTADNDYVRLELQ